MTPDRITLTEREEAIAQRAAEIAIEKVAAEIGKAVIRKSGWFVAWVGAAVIGLYWLLGGFRH